jgi:hypothetical protein
LLALEDREGDALEGVEMQLPRVADGSEFGGIIIDVEHTEGGIFLTSLRDLAGRSPLGVKSSRGRGRFVPIMKPHR